MMETRNEDILEDKVETQVGQETIPENSPAEDAEKGEAPKDAQGVTVSVEEFNKLQDKNLRLYAEFENFRRRSARENFEVITTANAKLITSLTDVLDNFNRAFEAQEKSSNPEEFTKGVKLIQGQFKEILEQEGLEVVDPIGLEFDPNLHEALMHQASEDIPENHVITVFQKGYKLKAKVLKHAKVIVSKGKE